MAHKWHDNETRRAPDDNGQWGFPKLEAIPAFNIVMNKLGKRLRFAELSFRFNSDDIIIAGDDACIDRAVDIVERWT